MNTEDATIKNLRLMTQDKLYSEFDNLKYTHGYVKALNEELARRASVATIDMAKETTRAAKAAWCSFWISCISIAGACAAYIIDKFHLFSL
jgi:hypothetical protein